jgi:hypothetical protein
MEGLKETEQDNLIKGMTLFHEWVAPFSGQRTMDTQGWM